MENWVRFLADRLLKRIRNLFSLTKCIGRVGFSQAIKQSSKDGLLFCKLITDLPQEKSRG